MTHTSRADHAYLPELCDAMRRAGIVVLLDRGRPRVHPHGAVTPLMLEGLKQHRDAFIAALQRCSPGTRLSPFGCLRCGWGVVLERDEKCELCRFSTVSVAFAEPRSEEERRLLTMCDARREYAAKLQKEYEKLSGTVSGPTSTPVETVETDNQHLEVRAHALGGNT
jgi:hypothetical protein